MYEEINILSIVTLFCCKHKVKENEGIAADSVSSEQSITLLDTATVDDGNFASDNAEYENSMETDTFFIVVSDTSQDYYDLREQMFDLKQSTGLKLIPLEEVIIRKRS